MLESRDPTLKRLNEQANRQPCLQGILLQDFQIGGRVTSRRFKNRRGEAPCDKSSSSNSSSSSSSSSNSSSGSSSSSAAVAK